MIQDGIDGSLSTKLVDGNPYFSSLIIVPHNNNLNGKAFLVVFDVIQSTKLRVINWTSLDLYIF